MIEGMSSRLSIWDFLVDLLGSLVPGILFISLALLSVIWPGLSLIREVQRGTPTSTQLLEQATRFAESFHLEMLAFFVVASYVAGHFLFRQDPKVPDGYSYRRASATFTEKEKSTWVVQKDPNDPKADVDVQFPYRYLNEYLEARDLNHLAKLIPWKGTDSSTHHKRTKSFINILKIRLMFYFPERCGQITRNEAHVRLMSSIWYASNALRRTAVAGVATGIVAGVLAAWNTNSLQVQFIVPTGFSAIIIVLAIWARRTIERFLHYQRVREVIFVLETAYNAGKEKPGILEDIF